MHLSSGYTTFDEELQPPHPNFVRENPAHLRAGSTESVDSHESHESDVDLSYYLGDSLDDAPPPDEMHIAHETNILDLTNFDGDVDVALPGEAYLSRRLKKEGKLRRLQSRRLSPMEKVNQDTHTRDTRQAQIDHHATPAPSSRPQKIMTLSMQSTDRLLPVSPLSYQPPSAASETDLHSPLSHHSESPLHAYSPSNPMPLSSGLPPTVSLVTMNGSGSPVYPVKGYHDVEIEPEKPRAVHLPPMTTGVHFYDSYSAVHSTSTLGASDAIPFEMDEQEAIDVHVVSEHARPGKPRLDKVIADETRASKGAIVVACPSALFL